MKVFIIEDDASIMTLIVERFAQWKFDVVGVTNFADVLQQFQQEEPQLVMIDIQLPVYDGFHWCREIRMQSNVPILFLSSRDHPMDMVMAMQLGADDFMQKPFHMDVLVAKVQALLRRTYDYKEVQTDVERWCGASIQYDRAIVKYGEQQIELTKNELFILKVLVQQAGQIVSRNELMRKLWDDERFVNDNTLTVNVNRLRQRLEEIGLVDVIVTKKGLGYMAVAR
ncbi:MAG: response regulator transcription factor [Caryophanon sp.]|nr:response regulator transcription factor [Caryophanon sp.]